MSKKYNKRVLGKNYYMSNDTYITQLNNNDIIVGAPSSGKTGSIIYANLKELTDESIVVTDSKGLLYKAFKDELIGKGYDVEMISFVKPGAGIGYNPLDFIRRTEAGIVYQDIISLSRLIVPDLDDEKVWEQSAMKVVQFLLAYCLEFLPESDWNMSTIDALYHLYITEKGSLAFLENLGNSPDSYAKKIYNELEVNRPADRYFASLLAFCNISLQPFSYQESKQLFAAEKSFDFKRLGRKKTALFITLSDTDRTYDNVVAMMYTQAMQVLCAEADKNEDGRLDVPVRLVFDDFAANAIIPDFDKTLSVIRSRDIYATLVLQSLTQLNSMYGKDRATTILNCCDNIIYMGTNDIETVDYISSRACKTAEYIFSMPRDMEYVITSGRKAQLVPKLKPYAYICEAD